jgi:hypothetical protein
LNELDPAAPFGIDGRETAVAVGDLGRYDLSFDLGEPERYRKEVPRAEVHVLDIGHLGLDTEPDRIAQLVQKFMK